MPNRERTLWVARPSQILNLMSFFKIGALTSIICFIIYYLNTKINIEKSLNIELTYTYISIACIASFFFLIKWLKLMALRYKLTTERLFLRVGIFNSEDDPLELYRVIDYKQKRPFLLKPFGKSHLILYTTDTSHPIVNLIGISEGNKILNLIRNHVEEQRVIKGIKERVA